jgi:ABC-type antimicrobial peptide transport system ATPase subunit
MQPEFGFPENQAILTLMAEQPKTLCKSSEIEVVRALMEETRFELNKLEFEIDHAEEKIKDHFNEQKRIIQLKTEETMEEVSRIADKLINEMNAYEKYCLNEMEAKKDENRSYLEKVIKPELNEYRETVNSYLKLTQLDIEQVKKANEIVLKMKMNIQDEISNSFSSLITFNKKLIVFNPNKNSVNEILLGSIDYQSINQSNVSEFE